MSYHRAAIEGAVSGAAGTVALTFFRATLARWGIVGETAPEQVIERAEEAGLLGEMSPEARNVLVALAHLGYGVSSGAAFGLLRRERGGALDEASVGAALGILSWAGGWAGWLWLLGVHSAPWQQKTPGVLLPVIDHAAYGAIWGLLYRDISRQR